MKKIKSPLDYQFLLHGLVAIALVVNIWLISSAQNPKSAEAGELKISFLTTPDCEECFDLQPFREYFLENGLNENAIEEIDHASSKGKEVKGKYDITQVPNIIVEGDTSAQYLVDLVENDAAEYRNNALVLSWLQPPYIDLTQDKVRGTFEAVYLKDSSCEGCYDVNDNSVVFDRLLMTPSKTDIIEANSDEGKLLVEEYFITAVPTLLLRGDLESYRELNNIWPNVGTIEEDGTYVLRNGVASMGVYKTLPEGDIIAPLAPEADNS